MSLKDQIADASDLSTEEMEVPEWGVTLTLRTPTLAERSKMIARFIGPDGTSRSSEVDEMYPALLIATCVDPETGAALFSERDVDLIRSKSGQVVERIAQRALRLAGMSDDAVPLPSETSSSTPSSSTYID